MNVVDSSGWLEYFANSERADVFEEPINDVHLLIVPTLSLYEVFKKILVQRGERPALTAVAAMQTGKVVDLDSRLSLDAAKLSVESKLPMADSIMLTTARAYKATLWTQDGDFEGIADVRYIATG